jgi:hypothetical protein
MKSGVLPFIALLGCAAAVLSACHGAGGAVPCVETMPGMTMCPDRLYPSQRVQSTPPESSASRRGDHGLGGGPERKGAFALSNYTPQDPPR